MTYKHNKFTKKIKCMFLSIMKWFGLFVLVRHFTHKGVRILCYHGIWLGDEGYPGDPLFMKQKTFESRLETLRKLRYPVVSLDNAVAGLSGGRLPPCPVVITIDDGWYSTYSLMWPALRRLGLPATLYCDTANLFKRQPVPHVAARYVKVLSESGYAGGEFSPELCKTAVYETAFKNVGDTVERLAAVKQLAQAVSLDIGKYFENKVFNYMQPEQLTEAFSEGLDVQLHSHNHLMHDFSPEAVRLEIEENRRDLSHLLGKSPYDFKHFCYPSGNTSRTVGDVLNGLGILSSATTELSIAYPGIDTQMLPRIMDGEHLTTIEFEAELSGIMDFFRKIETFLKNIFDF